MGRFFRISGIPPPEYASAGDSPGATIPAFQFDKDASAIASGHQLQRGDHPASLNSLF
jgi:hypothetical protein